MGKHILKAIKKIVEDTGIENVVIFTSNLKIEGDILIPEGKCEECVEDYIALKHVQVCRIADYCTCEEDNCDCNDYICFRYDWLNVNTDEIVAFSVAK